MFKTPADLNIISIDPSMRSTGITYCINGKISTVCLKRKEERFQLIGWYIRYFATLAKSKKWDIMIVEGYSMMSNGRNHSYVIEIGAIIRACFASYNVPILEISPQSWKSISGLNEWEKNNNKKLKKLTKLDLSLYREACYDLLGISAETFDEMDSLYFLYSAIQASKGLCKNGTGSYIRTFLEEHQIVLENKIK